MISEVYSLPNGQGLRSSADLTGLQNGNEIQVVLDATRKNLRKN